MSYYRCANGSIPAPVKDDEIVTEVIPTATDEIAKDDITSAIVEACISPQAVSKPVKLKQAKGHARRRVSTKAAAGDPNTWPENRCCYPPAVCARVQESSSIYCTLHTCSSINADGTRCPNLVLNPAKGRVCKVGYHAENDRYTHVEELITRRRAYTHLETLARESEHVTSVGFFDEHFSSGDSKSSRSSPPASERRSSISPDCTEKDKKWGAYGIDKWWIGVWRNSPNGSIGIPDDNTRVSPKQISNQ